MSDFLFSRRWLLAGVLLITALLIGSVLATGSTFAAWSWLGMPAMTPSFADLRIVGNAVDAAQAGIDPYLDGSHDQWGRLYNYPSVWLAFMPSSRWTDATGIAIALATIAALLALFSLRRTRAQFVAAALMFSPPVLLGIERGNVDLLNFSLIVLVCFQAVHLPRPGRTALYAAMLVVLSVLKIYPAAASLLLAFTTRRLTPFLVTALLCAIGVALVIGRTELSHILANTPRDRHWSFGSLVIAMEFRGLFGAPGDGGTTDRILALLLVLASLGVALYVAVRKPRLVEGITADFDRDDPRAVAAVAFLAIYCFTFVLGANYEYRLIFLIGAAAPFLQSFDRTCDSKKLIFPLLVAAFAWSAHAPASRSFDEVVDLITTVAAMTLLLRVLVTSLRSRARVEPAEAPAGGAI